MVKRFSAFLKSKGLILLVGILVQLSNVASFAALCENTRRTNIVNLPNARLSSDTCEKNQSATSLKASPILLKDFSSAALGYFSAIRGPASFLAGGSLGALFLMVGKTRPKEIKDQTRLESFFVTLYHLSMMAAYTFSLVTIVVSTAAGVTIMHGKFDPMAETSYKLLKREFEFEYLSCRWSFLVSLFSFLTGVVSRAIIEFDLMAEEKRTSLKFVGFSYVALCSHLISYINQTLYCYPNFLAMTYEYFKVRAALTIQQEIYLMTWLFSLVQSWAAHSTAHCSSKVPSPTCCGSFLFAFRIVWYQGLDRR